MKELKIAITEKRKIQVSEKGTLKDPTDDYLMSIVMRYLKVQALANIHHLSQILGKYSKDGKKAFEEIEKQTKETEEALWKSVEENR